MESGGYLQCYIKYFIYNDLRYFGVGN